MRKIMFSKSFKKKFPNLVETKLALLKYTRFNCGTKFGCIAVSQEGYIGYSLCHDNDKWDKDLAVAIAIYRLKQKRKLDMIIDDIDSVISCITRKAKNRSFYFVKKLILKADLLSIKIKVLEKIKDFTASLGE